MSLKSKVERVIQASAVELKELDEVFDRINPTDPDRFLYSLFSKHRIANFFVVKKGAKIVSSAYTLGFSTGSSIIGGVFLDKSTGTIDSVLPLIRRTLEHLRTKGYQIAFSSVREKNITLYEALRVGGFDDFCKRRLGMLKVDKHAPRNENASIVRLERLETIDLLKQFTLKETAEGVFTYNFWPHKLSDMSIDFLSKSNIFALSDKYRQNVIIARTAFAEYAGRRWFILPFDNHIESGMKKVGELVFSIGDNPSELLSQIINIFASQGIDRIYAYNYGNGCSLAHYVKAGFEFEQPQILMYRKLTEQWQKNDKVTTNLDSFWSSE